MPRAVVLSWLLLSSCLKSTPFESEPDTTDLTRHELQRLDALGSPPERFRFVAFGDTHDDYQNLEHSVSLINGSHDTRFALIAGDLTDRATLQEFEWSGRLYQQLEMPFLTVIGNHDALSNGKTIYQRMYGPLNYSFRQGPLKFVVFDSNTLETPSAPDRSWLNEQLEELGDARGAVLLTHQSPVDPDDLPGGDNAEFYDDLLASGKVVLVVHGHLDEQRLRIVRGVPIFQCGTYQTQFLHTFIDFDGHGFSFQSCRFEQCRTLEPEPGGELTATLDTAAEEP